MNTTQQLAEALRDLLAAHEAEAKAYITAPDGHAHLLAMVAASEAEKRAREALAAHEASLREIECPPDPDTVDRALACEEIDMPPLPEQAALSLRYAEGFSRGHDAGWESAMAHVGAQQAAPVEPELRDGPAEPTVRPALVERLRRNADSWLPTSDHTIEAHNLLKEAAAEIRRLLAAAPKPEPVEPVAWCPALTYPGYEAQRVWANGKPRQQDIDYWAKEGCGITYAYAHPAAAPKPLTDEQIEQGRRETFSTENPFCPCDSKTMRKAVRWAERRHGIKEQA